VAELDKDGFQPPKLFPGVVEMAGEDVTQL